MHGFGGDAARVTDYVRLIVWAHDKRITTHIINTDNDSELFLPALSSENAKQGIVDKIIALRELLKCGEGAWL